MVAKSVPAPEREADRHGPRVLLHVSGRPRFCKNLLRSFRCLSLLDAASGLWLKSSLWMS
jgi:hypothetical protein